jgi:chorismate dehydratase
VSTVGVVPYLNAVPLAALLPPDLARVEATPARLARALASGELDAALLPVAEWLRGAGGARLGRHGIACEGEVESVLLFVPEEDPARWPRRVVVDPASRTSVALVRCLLAARYGIEASFEEAAEPGPDPVARPDAATLVIGDPAVRRAASWTGAVLDLGRAWHEWTGLPFVFAAWVGRAGLPPVEAKRLGAALDRAAERGLAHVERLAREHGPAHGMDPERAVRYLTRTIRFEIGPREEEGLARFESVARRLGVL